MGKKVEIRKVAGGVVINSDGKVVLVKTKNNHWVFPKGGVEEGESELQTAEREIGEETGINEGDLEFLQELGSYERPDMGSKKRIQQITLFLFTTNNNDLKTKSDKESLRAEWVELDMVEEMLSAEKDKEFFQEIKSRVREVVLELDREYENSFSEIKLK